jgi:hypothetical protein
VISPSLSERTRLENSVGSRKIRDDVIEETPDDELVMINSYLNGKQTITSLPMPNRNAIDIPKAFKLRFNSELQEEDIHMFPTVPPTGSAAIPKRGILKLPHRHNSVTQRAHAPTRSNSSGSQVSTAAPSKHGSDGTHDFSGSRPHMNGQMSAKHVAHSFEGSSHVNDSEEKIDDRDNSSVGSKDSRDGYHAQKQQTLQQQQQQMQVHRQQQLIQQQQQAQIRASAAGQQNGPKKSQNSDRSAASSSYSNRDELYQFIGLGSAPGSTSGHSAARNSQHQPSLQNASAGRSVPVAIGGSEGVTVEDRLHRLVSDMQAGAGTNGIGYSGSEALYGGQGRAVDNNRGPASSRDLERDALLASGAQVYKDVSAHPTLYELANMHLAPGSGPPGQGHERGASNSKSQLGRSQDPLAAFEMMQHGGAIKVE